MVVIRLARKGAKKRPFYHIEVADRRVANGGRYLARLGYFNPIASGAQERLVFDLEQAQAWLKKGAQPSPRVASLIKEAQKTTKAA